MTPTLSDLEIENWLDAARDAIPEKYRDINRAIPIVQQDNAEIQKDIDALKNRPYGPVNLLDEYNHLKTLPLHFDINLEEHFKTIGQQKEYHKTLAIKIEEAKVRLEKAQAAHAAQVEQQAKTYFNSIIQWLLSWLT